MRFWFLCAYIRSNQVSFRRTGPELRFWDRTFDEYSRGFGDLGGDHWWGLEKVRALGSGGRQLQMRIIVKGDFCVDKEKDYCSGQGKKGYWYGDWLIEVGGFQHMSWQHFCSFNGLDCGSGRLLSNEGDFLLERQFESPPERLLLPVREGPVFHDRRCRP